MEKDLTEMTENNRPWKNIGYYGDKAMDKKNTHKNRHIEKKK